MENKYFSKISDFLKCNKFGIDRLGIEIRGDEFGFRFYSYTNNWQAMIYIDIDVVIENPEFAEKYIKDFLTIEFDRFKKGGD